MYTHRERDGVILIWSSYHMQILKTVYSCSHFVILFHSGWKNLAFWRKVSNWTPVLIFYFKDRILSWKQS